jgi:hypothetical protein
VHQLKGKMAGWEAALKGLEKDVAFTRLLGSLQATQGHWCLSGTPLRNYKQVLAANDVLDLLDVSLPKTS